MPWINKVTWLLGVELKLEASTLASEADLLPTKASLC